MAHIREVFDALLDLQPETQLTMEFSTKQEYETVRTRLVKLWAERKEIILAVGVGDEPALHWSLCASWNSNSKVATGTFYLGRARRKQARSYSFTVETRTAPTPAQPTVRHLKVLP